VTTPVLTTPALPGSGGGWDDIVVGAGSAGAVLASRLSECDGRRVLLLEAGLDVTGAERNVRGIPVLDGYNWDYSAHITETGGRSCAYLVGKVVGGSSAVNGAIALRGLPADFDRWAAAGNGQWAWSRVRPHFQLSQVPVRCPADQELSPMAAAFLNACQAAGLPRVRDLNADATIGAGVLPSNGVGTLRLSTAHTHLGPARDRPNLTIGERCHVTRVLTTRGRAVGVEVRRDGTCYRASADRVTLCAGGISTPVILQRSGIGPADHLTSLGITVAADLPGVGQNLADHPAVAIWLRPKPGVCEQGKPWYQVAARASTSGEAPDINVFLASNVSTSAVPMAGGMLGSRLAGAISTVLSTPASRGTVTIRDAAPDTSPVIALRLAAEPEDVERIMEGIRLSWPILHSSPLAELVAGVLIWTDRMVRDDALLKSAIARFVYPLFHASGTARMGPAGDRMAVTDQFCRVFGVENLRVADASVMPSLPSAPPNLTCIMLAERVAGWMRQP
jgi:choline dehydrogenase